MFVWYNKGKKNTKKGKKKQRSSDKVATPVKSKSTVATTATTTATTTVAYGGKKTCHTDPCPIVPNFYLGSYWAEDDMACLCDYLVPLDSVSGSIWLLGWDGEIIYVPITDYKALPMPVLCKYVEKIALLIANGKSVGMFCVGGHGRTGYMATAILWTLGIPQEAGYDDPIQYVRDKYCIKAVESYAQMESLEAFTGIKGLALKHNQKVFGTVKGFTSAYSFDRKWDNAMYDEWGYDEWGYDKAIPLSTSDAKGYDEPLAADPCWDCLHSEDVINSTGKYVLQCELSYKTGALCENYYSWVDEKEYVTHKRGGNLVSY